MSAPPLTRRALGAMAALALAGCAQAPEDAVHDGPLRLATGPDGAVFREFGAALAGIVGREWPASGIEVLHTDASMENLRLLRAGECELALANIDARSEGPADLRTLGRVFESVLHAVVPQDSPLTRLSDLDGRTVTCGLPLSGTRFTTDRVFAALGIAPRVLHHTQAEAGDALVSGEAEAMLSLTGMPTPAIEALGSGGGYRFLDPGSEAERIIAAHPESYLPVTVPEVMYTGLGAAHTVGVPSLLVCRADLPEAVARRLTEIVFTHGEELSAQRPEAGQINLRTGVAVNPVRLHEGSRAWFRSMKP